MTDNLTEQWVMYHQRELARGTSGSEYAADGRRHWTGVECPADQPRYLSEDAHMWLPLQEPYDLQKIDQILISAFPPPKKRER